MSIESPSSSDKEIILDRESFLKRAKLQKAIMEIFLGDGMSDKEEKQKWIIKYGNRFDSAFEKRVIANPNIFEVMNVESPEFAILANEIADEIK